MRCLVAFALLTLLASCGGGGGGVPDPDPIPQPQTSAVEINFSNPTDTPYLIKAVTSSGSEVWQSEIAAQSILPVPAQGQASHGFVTVATVTGSEKITIRVSTVNNPSAVLWSAQYGKGQRFVALDFAFGD